MSDDLQQLFGSGDIPTAQSRRLTLLKRRGHPLLHLPRKPVLARQALSLYSAQRPIARLVRSLLRWGSAMGLTRFLPSTTIQVPEDSQLGQFMKEVTNQSSVPAFAVLSGNPNAPGRRFILVLFDPEDRPCAVIKAGLHAHAIRLIDQEVSVLKTIPPSAAGIPKIRATSETERLHALALDAVAGESPGAEVTGEMVNTLTSWIEGQRTVQASDVPAWQRLAQIDNPSDIFRALQTKVEAGTFHPALYHGDFASWNIKVSPQDQSWTVLDWERGELMGLPCWDWFHFQIQPAILVERLPADLHAQRINHWLADKRFIQYTRTAGVEAIRRELLLAYLLYSIEITKPSEGLQATRDLLNVLAKQWNAA